MRGLSDPTLRTIRVAAEEVGDDAETRRSEARGSPPAAIAQASEKGARQRSVPWRGPRPAGRAASTCGRAAARVVYFFAPPGLGHHLHLRRPRAVVGRSRSSSASGMHKPASRCPGTCSPPGNCGFVVGDAIRAFYEDVQGVESPFPGLADAAYLAAYPILVAGMVLLVRSRDKAKDRANVIDAMIITVSVRRARGST